MKRKILYTLLAMFVSLSATAAETVVKGTVVTDNNEPLPYAYISVEGRPYATQADKNGAFSLRLPDGSYRVTAKMMGYKSQTLDVNTNKNDGVSFYLEEDLINLSAVTVTGTRTPRVLSNSPVVTQIITAEDIQKIDATNIKDVLMTELPGLEFSYSMNQQVSLTMQGLGGMSVLFLVDGERLAGETLDNTDFLRLNTDNIERVEIVKGAASALYGSNSVGAVINIITKKATEPWSVNLNTHFGSAYDEQRHGGSIGFRAGKFNSLTNIQTNSTGTFDLQGKKDADASDALTVYGNRQWNFKEKLVYQLNDRITLTGKAGYYFHERNSSELQKDRARDFSGGLRMLAQTSANGWLDIGYTFDRYDKSDFYPEIKMDFLDYKNVQHSVRALYTHSFGSALTWTTGGDMMSDYLKSYQFAADDDHSQFTADLFTQAEWNLDEHWNFIGGLRADYFSKAGWNVTPKIAAMYKTGHLNLRGSYSGGFRAPTLKEMYMDFNMGNIFKIFGNTDLEAEHSHSFTLSGEYSYRRYSLTATGYYNIMNNEISTLWDKSLDGGKGAMVYQNIDGRNLLGADVTLAARYPCGIGAKLSYAYFHEYTRNGAPNTSDSRPHSLTAKVDYRKTLRNYEFDVTLSGRWLSSADYYTINGTYDGYEPTSSPGYTVWKLTVSQRFFNAFRLMLTVDNLFNYKPDTYAYNSPITKGTTFAIGASIDIEQLFKKN